jgi:hypothetical protein
MAMQASNRSSFIDFGSASTGPGGGDFVDVTNLFREAGRGECGGRSCVFVIFFFGMYIKRLSKKWNQAALF